jgi:hypothetical protein
MTFGILLDRWNSAIDVMIPKKQKSIDVSKLSTIMLFEADWNFLNKIVAQHTMAKAEITQTIPNEQYGSRKRKSAIFHATNKQI